MKKVLYITSGCIIFAVLAAAAFYFGYWCRTPVYSLTLVKKAIEEHNVTEFERRVNLDGLLSAAFDDVADAAVNEVASKLPVIGGFLGNVVTEGVSDAAKEPVVSAARRRITEYVQTGDAPGGEGPGSRFGFRINFAVLDSIVLGASMIEYTNVEGDYAVVGARLYPRGFSNGFVFQLEMRRENGVWRLQRIRNLREFCTELLHNELNSLPKAG